METDNKPESLPAPGHDDPAKVWWGSSSQPPRRLVAPEVVPPPPPAEWRWRWTPFFGIMYGPLPVGLFVVLPILISRAC